MKNKYPFYENDHIDSIVELLERSAKIYGDSPAIRFKKKKKIFEKSYNELLNDSRAIAQMIVDQKFSNKHIAVIGPSSYEWIAVYFGAVIAGGVIVPLDRELSVNELAELIKQADVDYLFYDTQYTDVADSLKNDYGLELSYFSLDEMFLFSGSDITLPVADPDKLSAILFTSGTTGKSKGVMLTQRNIATNVLQGLGAVDPKHGEDTIFSVLPFHHAYEFTCTVLGMLYKGVPICICSGLKSIQKDFVDFKPTIMFVVPLLAEKLYQQIELNVKKQGKEKAFNIGVRICRFFGKIKVDLTDVLFKEIKAAFGGQLKIIMCGGAPLSEDLIKKFNGIGINMYQGYGLTECSPLITVNFDYYHRPNSVGKVVQWNEVKVVDGEIWAKGLSVSTGYYNDTKSTQEAFEGGWFKTGDLGYIDEDNFVFLTGRKKNLIILDNGENVSAEELEDHIYKIPGVSETLVYGKDQKIIAEIFLDHELEISEKTVELEIEKLNCILPSYKNIDKVIFRKIPFEKTTSKKIKRYKHTEAIELPHIVQTAQKQTTKVEY